MALISFLAGAAQARNLSVGLKDAEDILPSILYKAQGQVNEYFTEHKSCSTLRHFMTAGKPAVRIEYPTSPPRSTPLRKCNFAMTAEKQGSPRF